ncbi:unnamed protein product [Microthlaspi erraticum]|uniref:Calmodulin n=1 Tax=Microthlaspi erraticum TaxID=1685480 RepID=A0A6D2LB96_9BRAS|nr:unnamed protein product [Microthlaspi erraticum]
MAESASWGLGAAFTGAVVSEALRLVIQEAKKFNNFKPLSVDLVSTMEKLLPMTQKMDSMQNELDFGVGELKTLKDTIQRARELVREFPGVLFYEKSKYTRKIEKVNKDLLKFCDIDLPLLLYRNQLKLMGLTGRLMDKVDGLGKRIEELSVHVPFFQDLVASDPLGTPLCHKEDIKGCITTKELETFMHFLGRNPTEAELQELLNLMAKKMKDSDLEEELKQAFRIFDVDQNGFISTAELHKVMNNLGATLTNAEAKEMMCEADANGDGQMSYEEFFKIMTKVELQYLINEVDPYGNSTIDFKELLNLMAKKMKDNDLEKKLKEAFTIFDVDQNGFISTAELHEVMNNLGQKLTNEEAKEIIFEADANGDGQMSCEEFLKIMTKAELHDKINEVDADGNITIDFTELLNLVAKKLKDNDLEKKLKEAFKIFGIGQNGFISTAELHEVMNNLGEKLTNAKAKEMICEADANGDGQMSCEEFLKAMTAK